MDKSKTLSLLEIERELSASREAVFSALTQPEKMSQWFFGMDDGYSEAEVDLRIGGKYTVRMYLPNKELACAPHGEYLEIDPPQKLVFTWTAEGFVEHSVVTITLKESEKGTLLHLRHELPEEAVAEHRQGWIACSERLEAFTQSQQP
ncbi:MAG: SRPBCC domain-containing protein [Opitutaceae bacterium]|nr:SRPBCC domain-containing protein [Opitutaceae bacterium]